MFQPRTVTQIREDIKNQLDDEIVNLNNFLRGSFNYDFITAYAEEIHEYELRLKAVQLSGFPNYAGKTLTEEDLEVLGISYLDPSDINRYMAERHLDELAVLVGVERDQGEKAKGKLKITTIDDTVRIDEGTKFTTPPDQGEDLTYFVDADGDGVIDSDSSAYVSPDDGETEVVVDAIAESIGDQYNVPAGKITYMPSPPPGVEAVRNPNAFLGGEDVQSTPDLRTDVKQALLQNSGGGTKIGMEGYIETNTEASSVFVDEVFSAGSDLDVVVDGGGETQVKQAMDASRPAGIDANLVRPDEINVSVTADLVGGSIEIPTVQDVIDQYLSELDIDNNFLRGQLTGKILRSTRGISDIVSMNVRIPSVDNESIRYQTGTDVYRLTAIPLGYIENEEVYYRDSKNTYELGLSGITASSVELEATVNGVTQTLSRGSSADYEVIDNDGDSENESISFVSGGAAPDDGTTFTVSYSHNKYTVSSVTDQNGNTYTVGTDVAVVDNDGDGHPDSLDWSINSTSPSDGILFNVDYTANTDIRSDLQTSDRQIIVSDPSLIKISEVSQ